MAERQLRQAELDWPAFQRPLARCDLSSCGGMCCYDGVYVDRNTADSLQQVAQARAVDFQECGVTLPSIVITAGVWRDESSGIIEVVWKASDFAAEIGKPRRCLQTGDAASKR
jgi:hypothetical protein